MLSWYHWGLAFWGALMYGFPSKKLIVIGVTGTSGKTTTVDFITRILEEEGTTVASISSVRFKIGKKEWKNEMKMSMGGRLKNQKFLRQAGDAGCKYVVLEVTSEGIKQHRHRFIHFDTAVFTNLSPEHIESHGSFENYRNEKLKLFRATKHVHVVNRDDKNAQYFMGVPAEKIVTFGLEKGDVNLKNTKFHLNVLGDFNNYNALAAIAVAHAYNISPQTAARALEKVQGIPGRMEIVSQKPLVVVDYAHTPEQLEKVYQTLSRKRSKLICVLGSCGGGRDKWKRPVLGQRAAQYCTEIIVTNEDPYEEDPMSIINQVAQTAGDKAQRIVDRKEAIYKAVAMAGEEDTVVITGKGSEPLMCVAHGVKIPWDDRHIARQALSGEAIDK